MKELLEHLTNGLTPGQNLFFIACLMAILTTIACWSIKKLIEVWFNLLALWKQQKNPDLNKQNRGIAYNKKTQKLVETCTEKVPFE